VSFITWPKLGHAGYLQVHGLFNLFDSDNDGKISKGDFDSCLGRNPLLIALFVPGFLRKGLSEGGDRMLEVVS
jgi:lysophosphatidylcholine acyltransferase/lyso-PAF acetyltransferase